MINKDLLEQLEPTDDQRGAARTLYGMFIAFIDEGFDESQAMHLVGKLLVAVIND